MMVLIDVWGVCSCVKVGVGFEWIVLVQSCDQWHGGEFINHHRDD